MSVSIQDHFMWKSKDRPGLHKENVFEEWVGKVFKINRTLHAKPVGEQLVNMYVHSSKKYVIENFKWMRNWYFSFYLAIVKVLCVSSMRSRYMWHYYATSILLWYTLIPRNECMNLQKKAGMFFSILKKLTFVPSFHQQTSVKLVGFIP